MIMVVFRPAKETFSGLRFDTPLTPSDENNLRGGQPDSAEVAEHESN